MARRRAFRWLLWSGLAAAGLLAAAALSSPLWLRPVAERQASAVLGRPVGIGAFAPAPRRPAGAHRRGRGGRQPAGLPGRGGRALRARPAPDGAPGRLGVAAPARGRRPLDRAGTARAARRRDRGRARQPPPRLLRRPGGRRSRPAGRDAHDRGRARARLPGGPARRLRGGLRHRAGGGGARTARRGSWRRPRAPTPASRSKRGSGAGRRSTCATLPGPGRSSCT